jgi:hypothetical protein
LAWRAQMASADGGCMLGFVAARMPIIDA